MRLKVLFLYLCIKDFCAVMEYKEASVFFPEGYTEDEQDILIAELGEIGFESFTQDGATVKGYIRADEFSANSGAVSDYLTHCGYDYHVENVADNTNWNAAWESNFLMIRIGDRCVIRAPFHEKTEGIEYDVVIMPKMSFGTGHHATTQLMLEVILDSDFNGKRGLDMGSGTGALAILAVKRGACCVDAVDVDEWAYENAVENIAGNGVDDKVTPVLGDASWLPAKETYDFILANINRNILLADMDKYSACLKTDGEIFFSGFLDIDVSHIENKAVSLGMQVAKVTHKDGWAMVMVKKL